MSRSTRRQFIKQTGVGMAGFSLLKTTGWSAARSNEQSIPPHTGTIVPGVHGYADQASVAAGDKITFHISSTIPHQLAIYRLGNDPDSPAQDELVHSLGAMPATPQPIHPGSYIHIEKNIALPLKALTLECWVRPWKLGAWSGLVTQYDYNQQCGFGLFAEPGGAVSFYLGDGKTFREERLHTSPKGALKAKQWQHIVATWNGREKKIWRNGKMIGKWAFSGTVNGGTAPLRLAAYGEGGAAANFFDGDLSSVAIYQSALDGETIRQRYEQRGLAHMPRGKQSASLLGHWTFTQERGEQVADSSGNKRHGRIVNHGTWMIGGPSFEHEVLRFADYDPTKDPRRGHGLRFASDDLYDCRWQPTQSFRVPPSAKPGMYVGRVKYEWDGKPHLYHITFVVKKAARRRKAPLLVLTSSNTWKAYSGTPFPKPSTDLLRRSSTSGMVNSPGNPPPYCFYRRHNAGQGCYQLGFRMPFVGADPYLIYGGPINYSHLARAERFAHVWLEQAGYDYDMITDTDLHRDPGILRGYKAVLINGHSEYWSIPAYEGLEKYLQDGGNAIVLSGNSLFWRVSFNEDCSIIECRKVDAPGEQMKPEERGESWHSHDFKRGGLMREAGYPGWKLIGLETLGWTGTLAYELFGPYETKNPDHFLFNTPERVQIKPGERFGFNQQGVSTANGHEFDIRLSTLSAMQEKASPAGVSVPPDPAGKMDHLANGITPWSKGGSAFDYFFRAIRPKNEQGGEMIYWERTEGGRVFNAGSIGAGWGIFHDQKFQALMRNVLHHFGVRHSGASAPGT
jgi:N,N-dimethylformamidase